MRYWGAKQGHDAVAQDLIHRPFVAMHGLHHVLQGRIEELLGGFWIKVTDQFSGAFEVSEQHRDLLAFAFEGASGGEDFLGKIGRGVGQRGTSLGGGGWGGGWDGGTSVPDPDQDSARLIGREMLGLNEFLFEGVEGVIIQLKLDLECPICHALTLTEEGNQLIEDRVKIHRTPSCPCGGPYGPAAAHGQQREATCSMYRKYPRKE